MINSYQLYSQENVYYIILTSQQLKGNITEDGIYKSQLSKPSEVQKSPSIYFTMASPDKKIEEYFRYADYDVEKFESSKARVTTDPRWAKVRAEELTDTLILPISFLKTIKPIDLDKELPTISYRRARELFDPLRRQKVYIIDRNDITEKTIKLIGVRYATPPPDYITHELRMMIDDREYKKVIDELEYRRKMSD